MKDVNLLNKFKKALQLFDQEYQEYYKLCMASEIYEICVGSQIKLMYSEQKRIVKFLTEHMEMVLQDIGMQGSFSQKRAVLTNKQKPATLVLNITLHELQKSKTYRSILAGKKEVEDKFLAKEKHKVVFISPFSYGKSTLVNALLGDKILQSDIRAETANITKLVYGKEKEIYIKRSNGLVEIKSYKNLTDLKDKLLEVTSARKDGNNVEEIIVETQVCLEEEITIVDSPGLFSRYSHHDKLSKKALEEGDMIVFIIDPAKVGESNYTELLKEYLPKLFKNRKDFCFVVSKRDLYDSEEEEKIKKEIQIVLEELSFGDADVFFVSAYQGMLAKRVINKELDWKELGKDKNIFVEEDGFTLRGREIKEHHVVKILEYSQIEQLRNRIIDSKNLYYGR